MRSPAMVAVVVWALVFVGTCVYLPWKITFPGGTTTTTHAFFFNPPTTGYLHDWARVKIPTESHSVDLVELVSEWTLVAMGATLSLGISGRREVKGRASAVEPAKRST